MIDLASVHGQGEHELDPFVFELMADHPASADALANAWAGVRQFMREPDTRPELKSPLGAALLLAKAMASCGEYAMADEVAGRIPDAKPLRGCLREGRLSIEDIRFLSAGIMRPLSESLLAPGLALLVDAEGLRRDRAFALDFALLPVFRRLVASALRLLAAGGPTGVLILRGWRSKRDPARNRALQEALLSEWDMPAAARPHVVWSD